ncbi:SIMPL domain-containing protein [Schlegelella sp. S2-27]|uniref:SIMPL domain-containing protein n=1 Tax=Caldimonas mangrovi TaxID=2944811 RepID=A0ABT0YSA4_9BURK|nr:SIMPL domain-containing protein [Caldimonas mangrovi]MCM5681523.1 SIMPL domain-containing protein [Caldimonas mangrovi]
MKLRPAVLPLVLSLAAWAAAPSVRAQPAVAVMAQPQNVVSLDASASIEVTKDQLAITLTTTKEGADASAVQNSLKQALDAALSEARKSAQPGQMDVRTGNFSLYPRYSQQGRITGWQGTAELVLEGKDLPRIAQTAGRLNTVTIAHIVQSLSREARERHASAATAQAIANYKAKAQTYAKEFGFAGYVLREVNVSTSEPGGHPQPMMRMAKAAMEDASVPVETGKETVVVTVSGSVVMK